MPLKPKSQPEKLADETAKADSVVLLSSYAELYRTLIGMATNLKVVSQITAQLELSEEQKATDEVWQRLETGSFSIAVVGEFRRGKSTVINALLGRAVLPSDVLPTTATINRVVYGRTPSAVIHMKNGAKQEVVLSELVNFVTRLTPQSEARADMIHEAVISFPTLFCQNNVQIIDTPGLSDDEAMTARTLQTIPGADAAVLVISALAPLSLTEQAFLGKLLETFDPERIMILVNMIDTLNTATDVERLADFVHRRVAEVIAASRLVNESKRSSGARAIRIFCLSAHQALRAKQTKDEELFDASQFHVFERALEGFLARDRGLAAMQPVLHTLDTISTAIMTVIDHRMEGLAVEAAEATFPRLQALWDAVAKDAGSLLSGLADRSARLRNDVVAVAEVTECSLINAAHQCIADFRFTDKELRDPSRLEAALVRAVREHVQHECVALSDHVITLVRDWVQEVGAALGRVHWHLAQTLEAAGEPPATGLSSRYESHLLDLAQTSMTGLEVFRAGLDLQLKPDSLMDSGQIVDVLAGHTLGLLGKFTSNDTVQKGLMQLSTRLGMVARQAVPAQLRTIQDGIGERLKRLYEARAQRDIQAGLKRMHVAQTLNELAAAVSQAAHVHLCEEVASINALIEARKAEGRAQYERQLALNMRRRDDFATTRATAAQICTEARNLIATVSRALNTPMTHYNIGEEA